MSLSDNGDGVAPGCCIALRPSIILRNLIVPEEMWEEFPKGLGYSITDYFVYQPGYPVEARRLVNTPDRYSLPFEEVWIHTKDNVKLHAFLIKPIGQESESLPTIIFFHGNAGNIGDRLDNAKLMHDEMKCNVLLVQYRGYGRSAGSPSEKGLYRDAKAAFEYVDGREDLDSTKIIVFGRSLGGAVAIDLASRRKYRNRVAGLIVENTFTGVPDIAKHLFPYRAVKWLPHFCFNNRFESAGKISGVKCPSLFIRGTQDEMIPEHMMKDLHAKCGASFKELSLFNGDHNSTFDCFGYGPKLKEFIDEAILTGHVTRTPSIDKELETVVLDSPIKLTSFNQTSQL